VVSHANSYVLIGSRRSVTVPDATEMSGDASLVDAARQGDRPAFGRLYQRYARLVHGILLARAPSTEVDDLVQDVFLLALRRLGTLRDGSAFGGWLAAIARNRAMDYHRRAKDFAELPEGTEEHKTGGVARKDTQQADALAALAAIRSLPEAYRETLILRFVEGMTGPEIAERTGLTPGSVRVNLHRGMQLLRERLGTSGVGAGG
jgi:RNA polymerase sigma-70 factor (ECF subfamily)